MTAIRATEEFEALEMWCWKKLIEFHEEKKDHNRLFKRIKKYLNERNQSKTQIDSLRNPIQ